MDRGETSLPDPDALSEFRREVLAHYRREGRHDLPWRLTRDPYAVLVSEVMLQQTQVVRVVPYYEAFLGRFPTVDALAAAPLKAVLASWQGLGYNRRALALKRAAEQIAERFAGRVPDDYESLLSLPGVGPATAAGVLAFAYNRPAMYLETNVRTVFLHHFFADRDDVSDREIVPLVEATVDQDDPRTWYYALLDYGAWLKRTVANPSRRSRHHAKQSRFSGSRRQARAAILRAVLAGGSRGVDELAEESGVGRELAAEVLEEMEREGLVRSRGGLYSVG